MIWLQIVTIVPMNGESIRRFGMVAPYLSPILVAIVKVRTPGNSVGVAFPKPRVEVRSASTLGAIYKRWSNAVSVALSRRRYPQQDNGLKCIGEYYLTEYNAFG